MSKNFNEENVLTASFSSSENFLPKARPTALIIKINNDETQVILSMYHNLPTSHQLVSFLFLVTLLLLIL